MSIYINKLDAANENSNTRAHTMQSSTEKVRVNRCARQSFTRDPQTHVEMPKNCKQRLKE